MLYIRLVLVVFLLPIYIHAYPNGAPEKVCTGSMLPHHHHLPPQPPEASPVTKFDSIWNTDNETISIRIESSKPIKGIFIQVRKLNESEPLGTFINIPAETHLLECSTGDGLTHSSPQRWKQLDVTWKKPSSIMIQEEIDIWATIVVDFKRFWLLKSTPTTMKEQKPIPTWRALLKKLGAKTRHFLAWAKHKLFKT